MSFQRVINTEGHRSQSRMMINDLDPLNSTRHAVPVGHISFNKIHAVTEMSQVLSETGAEIVQNPNRSALFH